MFVRQGEHYWPITGQNAQYVCEAVALNWCLTPQEYTVVTLMLAGF